MLWFWLTSVGHYSIYDSNDNFNAVLMTVVIMLGTRSQWYVDSHMATTAGSEWAHFKGVIYLTVECRALQQMWASVIFLVNFSYLSPCSTVVQILEVWEKDSKRFSSVFFLAELRYSPPYSNSIYLVISPLWRPWPCTVLPVWIRSRSKVTQSSSWH